MKPIFKTLGIMLIGAIFGALASVIFYSGFLHNESKNFISAIKNFLISYHFRIFLLYSISMFLTIAVMFVYSKRCYLNYRCDTQDSDLLLYKLDMSENLCLFMTSAQYSLGFIIVSLVIAAESSRLLLCSLIFAGISFFSTVIQIQIIKQIKLHNAGKKGDPSSIRFERDWLQSCDEAERYIIFQSSYKTYRFMKILLFILLIASIFWNLYINPHSILLPFIGIILFFHTSVYTLYTIRLSGKKQLNI